MNGIKAISPFGRRPTVGACQSGGSTNIAPRGGSPARPGSALMGDPGKCGKAVRPALSGTAPRSRQDKHLTDPPLHFSIRKKEVNAMTCDESLYRQYLSGDDEGLMPDEKIR